MVKSMFNARPVIMALEAADQHAIKASAKIKIIFNQFIDAQRTFGSIPKDATGAKIIGTMVRDGFADYVSSGAMGDPKKARATVSNYATGAARAFYHGVEWSSTTFQDPALAVPSATTGKTKTAKAGTVKTTDVKALIKTLTKALEQSRLMQNDALAAGIVDLILEVDPEFKESAE